MKKLTISKIGDMLNSLPFKEKEADEEGVTKVKVIDIKGKKIEKITENKVKVKRINDKDDLH